MSAAFSNGHEFECWSAKWCNDCKHDDGESNFCDILSNAMLGEEVPKEWSPGTDDLRDRYHCSKFERA
jgi:hypothetical protein